MNRHSLIFATALILLFSSSAYSDTENAAVQALMDAGIHAYKNDDCPKAIDNFNQIIDDYKHLRDDFAPHFSLVDSYLEYCNSVTTASGWEMSFFESHGQDLSGFLPLSLSSESNHTVVKAITDKLGVPAIKVYDISGVAGGFAVKPVPGAMAVFEDAPQFEGIVVDPWYMDNRVDVTSEEISDMVRLQRDVPRFIEHGRQRRYGFLAHEVAHMLLPTDLQGFYVNNLQKKDIKAPNARVKRILENLHDAISEGAFNRSNGMNWQLVNEMAADYVAGGILAYMEVGDAGVDYMLKMHDEGGVKGNTTHLRGKERIKIFHKGYTARSVE